MNLDFGVQTTITVYDVTLSHIIPTPKASLSTSWNKFIHQLIFCFSRRHYILEIEDIITLIMPGSKAAHPAFRKTTYVLCFIFPFLLFIILVILQKLRVRLGSRKTSLRPLYFNTDHSKVVLLLWFLTVTWSCCPYLYFGSAIMLKTYFSKFYGAEWPPAWEIAVHSVYHWCLS